MIIYLSDIEFDIEFRSYGREVIRTFRNKKMMIEGVKMESNDDREFKREGNKE
jgi:hypothetical protein